jgi:predicted nucleic acid-binding Zn finger protein
MKEYKLHLPESLKNREEEIKRYILVQHWKDDIFQSGFCACALGIEKFDFQTKVLSSFNVSFMGDDI